MHISNLLTGQSLFQTITQILQATSIGILFGSIYYRSKNIWSVIFLHSLYDFSIMLSDINLVKDCTYGTPSTSIALYSTFASILIILYYIFNALLILRTTDLKEKKKEIKDNKFVVIGLITTFILMMLPLGIFVTGYDEYQTCYNYEIKTVKIMILLSTFLIIKVMISHMKRIMKNITKVNYLITHSKIKLIIY